LLHSSYVYSARIFPEQSNKLIVVATACYDGKVRLWSIQTDEVSADVNITPQIELSLTEKPQKTLN